MTTPQLPLGLHFPAHQRFECFVAGDNAPAARAVAEAAEDASAAWPFLSGPEGAGKTHLLIACCQAATRPAQYLPLAALGQGAEQALLALDRFELLCIDDLQAIAGTPAEIALFDVYNRGNDSGATIVFAADRPPSRLPIMLPDLLSRLSSCAQFALKPLDEAQRRAVLKGRAAARGFELDDAVLDFLFRRNARDLGAMLALLDRVDRESLAAQRRITVPFLRRIMQRSAPMK